MRGRPRLYRPRRAEYKESGPPRPTGAGPEARAAVIINPQETIKQDATMSAYAALCETMTAAPSRWLVTGVAGFIGSICWSIF